MKEKQGCLSVILKLIGINISEAEVRQERLPYRVRDNFLSAAELSFFQVLSIAVEERFIICPKVRLFDLLYVTKTENKQSFINKIDRKHVDFVLCDPQSMQPRLHIELDDSSHQKKHQIENDKFKDSVFKSASLANLRVQAKRTYSPKELTKQIDISINDEAIGEFSDKETSTNFVGTPICPSCNIEMVERQARRGSNKGKRFWACPSYPDCREIVPID